MTGSGAAWFGLIAVALLAGCAEGAPTGSASASIFGGFTLAPHETRSIQIRYQDQCVSTNYYLGEAWRRPA